MRRTSIQKSIKISTVCAVFLMNVCATYGQMIVTGSGATIVATGSPQIVLNDISYKNEASSTHLSGTGLTLKFIGSGISAATISSAANYTTNPANVTIDRANGVRLQGPVQVSNILSLVNGKIDLAAYDLNLASGTIAGGSASSYVKTTSTGALKRNVGSSMVAFPVGDSTYNLAELTNSGAQSDLFSVRVASGFTTSTNEAIRRTWLVEEATPTGSNVTMRLYWNAADQTAAFTSATGATFIDHYTLVSGSTYGWVNSGGTSGTSGGQNYIETTGITSFSPFTVSRFATPLPVELMTLDAQCAGENVIVSWKTASEHNSLNFIVERSEDGLSWSEIQTVAAAGNSNTIIEYAIEDAGAARGVKYYRLIQVDQDGVQKIYGPVLSNCGSDNNIFMSFPNPSDAEITLVFNDNTFTGPSTLSVRDAHGRVVRSIALEIQPGTNSILIPDMELEPAVYYLQLEGDNFKSPVLKHSLR